MTRLETGLPAPQGEHVAAVPPLPPLAGGEGRGEGGQVPAWRLIMTLALAGALAGLLIVTVFQWAQPRILAHQAEVLRAAVGEVLKGPERTERFFVHQDALVLEPPAGTDTLRIQRVFLGYDAAGAPIGFAISGAEPGFMDLVHVIFGYDPRTRRVLGMKVLDNKETPGLGDAIEKDQRFVSGFDGPLAPLIGVKPGASQAENEVDMITGATISARTVISVINNRIEALQPLLEAHLRGAGS
jgi:Na+-translocating ferredoxin:NAD+ oxidoreductase subunit G